MRRRWVLLGAVLLAIAVLAAGCALFSGFLDDELLIGTHRTIVQNWPSENLAEDEFPLYVGAKWTYRDATPDVNPEAHAGFPLEREIVAMVQRYDPSTNLAHECYVMCIRKMGRTVGHMYLHRSPNGIQLFAIEKLPHAGTPNLIDGRGELIMRLPLRKDDEIGFQLEEGSTYELLVRDQERIPVGTIMTAFGPYASTFADAMRVQAEYGGVFTEILTRGSEDAWYSGGIGLARISASSRIYELMEFQTWEDIVIMDESHADGRTYFPPEGSILVISLRDEDGTAYDPAWKLCDRSDVDEDAVFSTLSGANDAEARHCDIGYSDSGVVSGGGTTPFTRLDTGTSVFAFKVRTCGREDLVFENRYSGRRLVYKFGAKRDPVLSEANVEVDIPASTAKITVRYMDPDGDRPAISNVVIIDKETDTEWREKMTFSHGARADGYYVAAGIEVERNRLYRYCFDFDDDPPPEGSTESERPGKCELPGVFEIGGTSP